MQKRTREIIALFLLIGLCIAGVCAMAWYILVGHNWNEAASNIDDHFGQLDQYTIVLVEGSATYSIDGENAGSEADDRAMAAKRHSVGGALKESGAGSLLDEDPVLLANADMAYVEKGAQTITVRPGDPEFYVDPVIVPRNGKRIAIYSVSGPLSDYQSRFAMMRLSRKAVDFSICVIDDANALNRGIGDVDIAICTDPKTRLEPGYIGRTFAISAPYVGQVAAVLVAPSGFVSSKLLTGL